MAGAREVATFAARYLADEAAFRRAVTAPVLLWQAPPEAPEAPLLFSTRAGQPGKRPGKGSSMFFVVKKSVKNAFADEVTLGRTANNDITIEDNSVSRFHAYFAPDKAGGWSLVDAKSTSGTFLGGQKLSPRAPAALKNGLMLKVGDVELQFLEPEGFWQLLRQLIRAQQ